MPSLKMTDLPDVNVLVAASDGSHEHHRIAREWLKTTSSYATTPFTESGLVRCLMNPRVVASAASWEIATEVLARIKANERAMFWPDDCSLAESQIAPIGIVGYRQITDLHLVDLAAKNGGKLVTLDTKIAPVLSPIDRQIVKCLLG